MVKLAVGTHHQINAIDAVVVGVTEFGTPVEFLVSKGHLTLVGSHIQTGSAVQLPHHLIGHVIGASLNPQVGGGLGSGLCRLHQGHQTHTDNQQCQQHFQQREPLIDITDDANLPSAPRAPLFPTHSRPQVWLNRQKNAG